MLNDIKAMILEKQNELDTIELLSEETKLHNKRNPKRLM